MTTLPPPSARGRAQNSNALTELAGEDDESSVTAAYTREVTQQAVAQVMKTGGRDYRMVLRSGAKLVADRCDAGAKSIEAATARASESIDAFTRGVAQSNFELGKAQSDVAALREALAGAGAEAAEVRRALHQSRRNAELFSRLGLTVTIACIVTLIAVLLWIIAIVPDAVGPKPRVLAVVAGLLFAFTVGASMTGKI